MKNEEIDEMIKEAPGPINFTVFLTMFGEKLKGKFTCTYVHLCLYVSSSLAMNSSTREHIGVGR